MSEKINNTTSAKLPRSMFAYRNIKKDFTKFESTEEITTQRHLELTEYNGTKIVDDRNVDWFMLAQQDADSVGLANILALATKNKQNLAQFAMRNAEQYALKDSETADISMVDPMNPDAMEKLAQSGNNAENKLKALAQKLDLSLDQLIENVVNGTLEKVISDKLVKKEENEGGKE